MCTIKNIYLWILWIAVLNNFDCNCQFEKGYMNNMIIWFIETSEMFFISK